MTYALIFLRREANRYLPAILAVAFSALLVAMQCGLLLGTFSLVSVPIDRSNADVWVGHAGTRTVDVCRPIPAAWESRVASQPEVERVEAYLRGLIVWAKRDGGLEFCGVIGSRLDDGALGVVRDVSAELRARLSEPGAIVVDERDLPKLGLKGVGDSADVNSCRVRLVGTVRGLAGIAGVFVYCSIPTARQLMRMPEDDVTYFLARCRDPGAAPGLIRRLNGYPGMVAFAAGDFSRRSRLHWLTSTRAGIALGLTALLGLLVGAAVTSQTLYAATAASLRQYAVLEALGIPSWRMATFVMSQALWVGVFGALLAVPATLGLARVAGGLGAPVQMPLGLLGAAAAVTFVTALLSGLVALRSLRLFDPTALLR